ncbi:hypothetical protein BGZ52_001976 [Haplosporangium bisporale]|nr:hypothetical protein BGZ52_001976 [Haplosporangium bisporale]
MSTQLCLLLALSIAVQITHGAPPGKPLANNDVCTSAQCVITAADIIRDLRMDVDPCGGFEDREEIPADEESVGYFKLVQKQNNRIIHSILAPKTDRAFAVGGDQDSDAEESNLQKLRALFTSCMDEDQINKVGRQPVVDEIKKLLTLFPTKGSFLSSSPAIASTTPDTDAGRTTALAVTIAHMTKLGLDSFTGFGVSTDVKNPSRKVLAVSEGGLGLPSEETLAQIAELTPAIDWFTLLEKTLAANTQVPDPIIVSSPGFHTRLQQLLQQTSTTTLQNYFTWSMIRQLSGSLSVAYRQPLRELQAVLSGVAAGVTPDRWKTCVGFVNANLGDMAGQYFVEQAFKGNSRDVVNSLIDSLRATYAKGFPELDWLDDYTKKGASDKMSTIVQLIGFSTESPNVGSSRSLQEYYEGYQIDASDYFGNKMRANLWGTEMEFRDLNEPVNRLKMHMSPQTVNAYYSATLNGIVFPAGILQPPFFHVENPEYINYGGIGVVAGHELGHGFDNRGRLFDSTGRMVNWWSNSTLEAFQAKAQCFVDQYGNFTVKGADGNDYNLNGELTLGENIADNGGLKKSYESWVARYQSDPKGKKFKNFKLPGLESLTPEQLFFISYARPWCRKQRPQSVVKQIRTDPHSPAEWRINGAVQNSVHFAEAFKCKRGARMNPKDKCDLW